MRPEPPARYRTSLVGAPVAPAAADPGHPHGAAQPRAPALARSAPRSSASRFAAGILVVGFVFIDAMDADGDMQFSLVERQDVTVTFVEPVSAGALDELACACRG